MTADAEHERQDHHLAMLKKYVEYFCWVSQAKEKNRFFHIVSTVKCANFAKLRRELKKRGFVELNTIPSESVFLSMPNSILLEEAKNGNEYEQALVAKMIGRRKPDLVFLNKAIDYRYFHNAPFLSKIAFSTPPGFISKNGMLHYVETIKKRRLNKGVYFPRAYDVGTADGVQQFLDDFRLNAALSLIQFLYNRRRYINMYFTNEPVQTASCRHRHRNRTTQHEQSQQQQQHHNQKSDGNGNKDNADSDAKGKNCEGSSSSSGGCTSCTGNGTADGGGDTVRINGLDYAILVISMHIKYADGNLSRDELARYNLNQAQWREVVDTHAAVIKHGKRISYANCVARKEYVVAKIQILGEDIPVYWPNIYHDGLHNLWLLKPSYTGQGWGIILESDERRLLELMKNKTNHYICQKYIERPLLAYNTKLDLRQYYLVVIDKHFIRFWSHPLCAVRLASTEFTLDTYDERPHITNTSIQMKYQRESTENLPCHHMWSTDTLTDYFEKIGKPKAWRKLIYPSIKRTLKAVSKISVDHIDLRPGRFELFGCDWLITEDLKTYLLEINRCPSLYYYTPVSEFVVGRILEDMIKVVVDFHDDKSASTGDFELLYEYELPNSPRRVRQRQIIEENRQKQIMMDEIIRDIVNDVITVINVAPPPENEVDVSQEVKEMFDPYKQMLLATI